MAGARIARATVWATLAAIALAPEIASQSLAGPRLPPAVGISADAAQLYSLGPRAEGSATEWAALDYVRARTDQLGLQFIQRDFSTALFAHSFSGFADVTVPGLREDTLLFVVPLSSPVAADSQAPWSGNVNVSLGLAILDTAARAAPPVTVRVLFLGAEHGAADEGYPLGSRLFLEDFTPSSPVAVIYLDMDLVPSRVTLHGGAAGTASPFWLTDRVTQALSGAGIFFRVRGNETQLLRMGLQSTPQLEPYLQAGYPALELIAEGAAADVQSQGEWVARLDPFVNELFAAFDSGIPEEWDRHFLFFQIRDFFVTLSELNYLLLILAAFAAVIAFAFAYPERVRRYRRAIWKNATRLMAAALLMFGALWVSGALLQMALAARGIPLLWESSPVLFFVGKLALGLLLAAVVALLGDSRLLLPLRRRLWGVSTDGGYHTAAALTILLVDSILVALLDISLSYYFVWAFLFTVLFSVSRGPILKLVWLAIAPYWIVKSLFELLALPALGFAEVVLFSPIWGALAGALILLPFVLLAMRVSILLRRSRRLASEVAHARARKGLLSTAAVGFAVISAAGLAAMFIHQPYGLTRPQPVTAHAVIDATAVTGQVRLASPAPLGELTLLVDGAVHSLVTGRNEDAIPVLAPANLVVVDQTAVDFLQRRTVKLTLAARGQPNRVRIQLFGPTDFVLFDSNYPSRRENPRSYAVLVGSHPPGPLEIELTLPREQNFSFNYSVHYEEPPIGISLAADDGRSLAITSEMTITGREGIET